VTSSVIDPTFWRGKRVLLTGHTGFKGSWISLWLQALDAELQGLALAPPTSPSLFVEAGVETGMVSTIGDVRDAETVRACMHAFRPEIVIHMAAQSLVRTSYDDPMTTYATNVMGTVHVLEAARSVGSVRAIVNVTTDKCYENREWVWGYREGEPMGGHDPYSSSKGCAELVTSAYQRSFFNREGIALASARAGNVIGGGDWATDRLVPDVLRAFERNAAAVIRNPHAIRPWQHVLEPLSGYLLLAQRLHSEGHAWAEPWNFGPHDDDAHEVRWIAERLAEDWGSGARWCSDDREHPHEAHFLKLDTSKARARLGWKARLTLTQALQQITAWHKAWLGKEDVRQLCLQQIAQYANMDPA